MDPHDRHHEELPAERTTRVLAHLDGALDETMLDAMTGTWSMLEHAAADGASHARAVRARLFWESLRPGGVAAAPTGVVHDLEAGWEPEAHDADEHWEADAA